MAEDGKEKKKKNLRRLNLTHEQLVENGRKGGKKSAAARRRRRTLKADLLAMLNENINGKTAQEWWVQALGKNLLRGDVKTSIFVRDTIGEMPRENESEDEAMREEMSKGFTIEFVDASRKERENDEKN